MVSIGTSVRWRLAGGGGYEERLLVSPSEET